MPLQLKEAVTIFLSVRKGLERCLLREIKRNPYLNSIDRIHYTRREIEPSIFNKVDDIKESLVNKSADIGSSKISASSKNKWIVISEQTQLPEYSPKVTLLPERKTKLVDNCTLRLQSGGIEAKCNKEWVIRSLLALRSVESIWLRVGTPFRCHNAEDFTQRISLLPWNEFLPNIKVESIPVRVISRHSSLWSPVVIRDCLRQGIRLYNSRDSLPQSRIESIPDDLCISVTLNRNTCYIAIQCSSRLSPRHFNLCGNKLSGNINQHKEFDIPFWSLSKTRIQARLDSTKRLEPKSNTLNLINALDRKPESISVLRNNYIEQQEETGGDQYDTADALVAGLLHTGVVLKALEKTPIRIWNPFCGNGIIVSEIVSLLLRLPNFTEQHPPSEYCKELLAKSSIETYESILRSSSELTKHLAKSVDIVASDTSLINLRHTSKKLNSLYDYYKPLLPKGNLQNHLKEQSSLYSQYCNRFPIQLELHHGSVGVISPLVYKSTVITKIPPMGKTYDNNTTYEIIKTYKDFGHIIASRSDWNGVFAIARGRAFEYYSGLDWQCVTKVTNSVGSVIKLLKWSGKTRQQESPEELYEQLQEL